MLNVIRKKSALFDRTFSFFFEHEKWGEKMRYLFVGGSCAATDLAFLYLLVDVLHFWYLGASVFSFTVVSFVGYFGQKYFTFKNDSQNHKKQLPIFFVMAGTGLLINSLSMYLLVDYLGLWYLLASATTKFIVLIWNFTASKYITFRS